MAKLVGISVRPALHAPIQLLDETMIYASRGLEGDHRRGRGARQVTVLFKDGWDAACREVGVDLPWQTRRANLFVEGVWLAESVGTQLQIGEALLEITGETHPCQIMEDAQSGLRAALTPDWRAGVTCRVLREGAIHIGDEVAVVEAVSAD